MSDSARPASSDLDRTIALHLKLGWLWLGVFSLFGLLLEALHGFKLGAYLDVGNETRRLMWTLAHAHGSLLGLVQFAFAFTLSRWGSKRERAASCSRLLVASAVLMPAGFFLGGLFVFGGDPGWGIFLVPLGALPLIGAAFLLVGPISASPDRGSDGSSE